MRNRFFILISTILFAGSAFGNPTRVLTPMELFSRCYTHLTQLRLPPTHPLRATVTSNATAVQACMTILSETSLDPATGKIALATSSNTTSAERLATLRNFQNLHTNFATNTDLSSATPNATYVTRTVLDETEFALYFTRALFTPAVKVDEIVTGTAPLEAVRSNGRYVGGPAPGVQTGDFLGVKVMPSDKLDATVVIDGGANNITSTPINKHQGGGVVGSQTYALMNFGLATQRTPDGGLAMPRRWAKAVFKDLLGRDVPVIRASDPASLGYIQTTNTVGAPPFRTSASCVQCHASMDPMAATVRNFTFDNAQATNGGVFLIYQPFTTTETAFNPFINKDPDFWEKTPNGILRFRSYNGSLIEKIVNGPAQLGAEIAKTDDFYAAIAARYFRYFTGITAHLKDIGDPDLAAPTTADLYYRNLVISLGATLKTDRSLPNLIKNIMLSSPYQSKSMRSGGP